MAQACASAPVSAAARPRPYFERPNFPSDLKVALVCSSSTDDVTLKLKSLNYEVVHFSTCASLAPLVAQFDVVLAEMSLVLSNLSAASVEQLKSNTKLVPIVLFGDVSNSQNVWDGLSFGAADVLSQPVSKNQLQMLWQHVVRIQRPVTVPQNATTLTTSTSQLQISKSLKLKPCTPVAKAPVALATAPDNKKRKICELPSQMVPVHIQTPNKVPTIVPAMGVAMGRSHQPPPQMVGYWTIPNVAMPPVIASSPQFSWGHPVVGMPANLPKVSVGFVPGQLQPWAPHAPCIVRHAVTPIQIPCQQPLVVAQGSVAAPNLVTAPVTTMKVVEKMPCPTPSTSEDKSQGSTCASSESEFSSQPMTILEEDLVSIPDLSSCDESYAENPLAGQPTSLNDIGDDEYAFIDFALSDDFPSYDEDEIIPPLGITLKKSNSLLNMLNMQAPVF